MSDHYDDEFDAPIAEAPPTAWQEETRRSSWPTVIGIIGIVIAILALLGSGCMMAMPALTGWMRSAFEDQPEVQKSIDQMLASMGSPGAMVVFAAINLVLAVFLLVGSIKLLKRRRAARSMLMMYAGLEAVRVIVNLVYSMKVQADALAAMSEGADTPQLQAEEMGQTVGLYIGGCFGLIMGLAMPIFLLIWFMRSPIKNEVAGWESDAGDAGHQYN